MVKCGIVLSAVKVVNWLKTFELFQMKVELWILSGVLESFLSLQLTVKVCIFFCLQKIISEVKEKCEIKLWRAWASDPSHSCRWSPWPSLEVGLDLIVLLVQMTTMVFWSLLNLFFALLYKQVTSVFTIQWLSVPWNLLQVNNGSLQCGSRWN